MPPKTSPESSFRSPFATMSQQARSGSLEMNALSTPASLSGDGHSSGHTTPEGTGAQTPSYVRRRGSAGKSFDAPPSSRRPSFLTTAQEDRLREASFAVAKDVARRRSVDVDSFHGSGELTPSQGLTRVSRSQPRKSLEQYYQLGVPRSHGNSGQETPRMTPHDESEATTATNSLASLSATTQDLVDLELLRRTQIRGRASMGRNLPGIDETLEVIDRSAEQVEGNRAGFGYGAGWSILTPDGPSAQKVQLALAYYAEETENNRSWMPIIKILPTVVGKMGVALGADMLTLGLSNGSTALRWAGGWAIGLGVISVYVGMFALIMDMKKINPQRIPATVFFSLFGMIVVTTGLIVGELDIGAKSLAVRSGAAATIGVGLVLLNESLPLSFAYCELVHGDCFRSYRNEWARFMQGIGLGAATGLTLSRGAPRDNVTPTTFPFGVAHAFAVLGIAMVTMQNCLVTTNVQRGQGKMIGLRTRLRRLAQQVREAQEGLSPPGP